MAAAVLGACCEPLRGAFQGRKLLIIGTTSEHSVLKEMKMLSCFSAVIHVSNLTTSSHLMAGLDEIGVFSDDDLRRIANKTNGRRWGS